jgi:hypothetical protein
LETQALEARGVAAKDLADPAEVLLRPTERQNGDDGSETMFVRQKAMKELRFVVIRPNDVPMPPTVAARPRDDRGYPVPAITPWPDGKALFAQQSAFRTLICLAERRCTVCGTKIPPGPVYRVVDGGVVSNIALALHTGKSYINLAPAAEGPGHRSCMIYSAVTCPHLTSPGARRKIETRVGPETLPKGDPRGPTGAVVGYESYSYEVSARGVEIYCGQPVELLEYGEGIELINELTAEITRAPGDAQPSPPYLLDDDAKAERTAKAILMAASPDSRPAISARRQQQARKNRRKVAKTARRRNR